MVPPAALSPAAAAGKLSADEYPFVKTPSSPGANSNPGSQDATPTAGSSARTVRTTGAWARKGLAGSPEKEVAPQKGRRLFCFVVGGLTYSEIRTAHKLSARLGRDVFVGGTSVESPHNFMSHVLELASMDHVALEVDGAGAGGRFRFS